jgi:arginine/lysine/ornithine decarboxylase
VREFNAAFPGFDTDVHGLVEEEDENGRRTYFMDCVRAM